MPLGVLTLDQLLLGSSYSDAKEGADRSWLCICRWLMDGSGFIFLAVRVPFLGASEIPEACDNVFAVNIST